MTKADISIVIPCYNEQEAFSFFERKMESIFLKIKTQMLSYECLVIDDGSKDLTWVAIMDWANTNS